MKSKWARGIPPRFFAWIIKDKLAVSERPGGYARNHRRVRRQEEILWLRGEGFTRVVSLLTSPHNLHAYDELDVTWAHLPFGPHDDPHQVLPDLYRQLRTWMASGERILLHQEELSDRLMGVVAGYLRWSQMVPDGPQAITVVERILHRQMGPDGRKLVAVAPSLSVDCRSTPPAAAPEMPSTSMAGTPAASTTSATAALPLPAPPLPAPPLPAPAMPAPAMPAPVAPAPAMPTTTAPASADITADSGTPVAEVTTDSGSPVAEHGAPGRSI